MGPVARSERIDRGASEDLSFGRGDRRANTFEPFAEAGPLLRFGGGDRQNHLIDRREGLREDRGTLRDRGPCRSRTSRVSDHRVEPRLPGSPACSLSAERLGDSVPGRSALMRALWSSAKRYFTRSLARRARPTAAGRSRVLSPSSATIRRLLHDERREFGCERP